MHCLDRLTWLIGSEVESVCARFDTRFHDQEADDVGLVFLRHRNGSFGSVVSTGWKVGVTDHLTEMTCTKGMLRIEYTEGVSIGRDEKWLKVPEPGSSQWMEEALLNEWRAFISAIDQGTPSPVTGSYARHIMSVVFAAEESSNSKCEIAL